MECPSRINEECGNGINGPMDAGVAEASRSGPQLECTSKGSGLCLRRSRPWFSRREAGRITCKVSVAVFIDKEVLVGPTADR